MKFDFDKVLPCKDQGLIKWGLSEEKDAICMGVADMDFQTAPCVTEALTRVAGEGRFAYHFKPEGYYQTVENWYERRYQWKIDRSWLLNTPGTWAAFRMCLMTYSRPGDYIIIQAPHFRPIIDTIELAGCRVLKNDMYLENEMYKINFEDFEEKIREYRPSIYFMVNPHNPSGRVFTQEELERLGDICRKYGVVVVSDEVHSIITYGTHFHIPAAAACPSMEENSVVLIAPSKGYNLMDLTYCMLVIRNEALRIRYEKTMQGFNYHFATNIFGVTGVQAAFSREADPWLDALTGYLGENLRYLREFLEAELPEIKMIEPEGGYFVWLDCRGLRKDAEQLRTWFERKAKVVLTWGEGFGHLGNGFERMNIACPKSTLEEALRRIKQAL